MASEPSCAMTGMPILRQLDYFDAVGHDGGQRQMGTIMFRRALTFSGRQSLLVAAALLLAAECSAYAQQSAIQRKSLLTQDGPPGYQTIVNFLEIAPGGREVKHTHPGPLAGYILEGTLVLEHEGRPTATYQAGEAFYVDAGKIHYGINSGNVPVKLIATLIVEKGKPPSTPVP